MRMRDDKKDKRLLTLGVLFIKGKIEEEGPAGVVAGSECSLQKIRAEIRDIDRREQHHLVVHVGTTGDIWASDENAVSGEQKNLCKLLVVIVVVIQFRLRDHLVNVSAGRWQLEGVMRGKNVNTVCSDSWLQSEAAATSSHPQPMKSESQCSSTVCSPFSEPFFEVP